MAQSREADFTKLVDQGFISSHATQDKTRERVELEKDLINVSADAVTDEKKGSYYPATLALEKKDMLIDVKHIPISPGMNVTAEIKTGKRRIIEFLLSPVQKAGSESLRER